MKSPLVQPYLFFGGRCDEALAFYQKAIGARIEMRMSFSESPEPMPPGSIPRGFEKKVMHAAVRIGESLVMASDGNSEKLSFCGFSLSLACASEDQARQSFDALAEGGRITMPISKTFWSPCFGMLQDRFGVGWMVSLLAPESA